MTVPFMYNFEPYLINSLPIFGLKNAMERGIVVSLIASKILGKIITEAFVISKRLIISSPRMTEQIQIIITAPLTMHNQRSKSTPDSLKSILVYVFRRKPSLGAPKRLSVLINLTVARSWIIINFEYKIKKPNYIIALTMSNSPI